MIKIWVIYIDFDIVEVIQQVLAHLLKMSM